MRHRPPPDDLWQGLVLRTIVTDKARSYRAALRERDCPADRRKVAEPALRYDLA
jgi:hypothetical protein